LDPNSSYDGNDFVDCASDRLDHYLHKNPHLNPAELQHLYSLKHKLQHHTFEIVAFGLVSCGKTSVLNALQGKKVGLTSPIHGTTKAISSLDFCQGEGNSPPADLQKTNLQKIEKKIEVKLIDTPGLDEVGGETRAEIALKPHSKEI